MDQWNASKCTVFGTNVSGDAKKGGYRLSSHRRHISIHPIRPHHAVQKVHLPIKLMIDRYHLACFSTKSIPLIYSKTYTVSITYLHLVTCIFCLSSLFRYLSIYLSIYFNIKIYSISNPCDHNPLISIPRPPSPCSLFLPKHQTRPWPAFPKRRCDRASTSSTACPSPASPPWPPVSPGCASRRDATS